MHIKRLFVVVLTASIVAAGLLLGAPAQGAAPATASAASAGIAPGTLLGPRPGRGARPVRELRVPLDYNRPGGAKITLAVSRVLHTSSDADYQGVMLVNPGGPGGAGLGLAVLGQFVPNNAGAAYDWIGFDPRGVGASTPSLSCIPDYFGYNRPYYVPVTRVPERTWLERSESYADACQRDAAALLPHMKTTDSARDMESIRTALGARRINYYGFSYGTYLAQVYSTLFPLRVRRMVLDNPAGGLIGGSEWTDAFLLAGYNQFFWRSSATPSPPGCTTATRRGSRTLTTPPSVPATTTSCRLPRGGLHRRPVADQLEPVAPGQLAAPRQVPVLHLG